jgi:hypothetical protein
MLPTRWPGRGNGLNVRIWPCAAVFDTNVVVSALVFGGRLRWLRQAWVSGAVMPIVCRETTTSPCPDLPEIPAGRGGAGGSAGRISSVCRDRATAKPTAGTADFLPRPSRYRFLASGYRRRRRFADQRRYRLGGVGGGLQSGLAWVAAKTRPSSAPGHSFRMTSRSAHTFKHRTVDIEPRRL